MAAQVWYSILHLGIYLYKNYNKIDKCKAIEVQSNRKPKII